MVSRAKGEGAVWAIGMMSGTSCDGIDAALELFAALQQLTTDTKRKRELYYWMADSHQSQEEYAEAARLYLKSAMLIGPDAMDPWAQTARYQAGVGSGAAAGADDPIDAQVLFKQLCQNFFGTGHVAGGTDWI